MQCPVCTNTQLVMSERQGIEIDYCPQCRGVWLDRGELDKIIDRSATAVTPTAQVTPEGFGRQPVPRPDDRPQNYPQGRHEGYKDNYHHRKKKGFLGELFDFD